MTLIAPSDTVAAASTGRAFAPLNIADALDLLCAAVNDRGHGLSLDPVSNPNLTDQAYPQANGNEPRCIIAHALSRAGVTDAELDPISNVPVRNLYRDGRLPIPITLGALIVFDAAQRSQASGRSWSDVLDDAVSAAARFLDLVHVLPEVTQSIGSCRAALCPNRQHQPRDAQPPVWDAVTGPGCVRTTNDRYRTSEHTTADRLAKPPGLRSHR
jgi:hypothetical protein